MTAERRTRIKICGITRAADLDAACAAGADAIGLVMVPRSPRALDLPAAQVLARRVPALVQVVALLVDPSVAEVEAVLAAVAPDLLQFHGRESAAFCEQFGRRYIKAIGMGAGDEAAGEIAQHENASAWLLDSHAPGKMGGSGQTFDWRKAPAGRQRLILAGGLNADNVGEAISQLRPYAVDVSSGVETAPGIKSAAKIAGFIQAVRTADAACARVEQ